MSGLISPGLRWGDGHGLTKRRKSSSTEFHILFCFLILRVILHDVHDVAPKGTDSISCQYVLESQVTMSDVIETVRLCTEKALYETDAESIVR